VLEDTGVDRLYKEFKDLVVYLEKDNEISLKNTVDENFRKALLLAAASYFESRITDDIVRFVDDIIPTSIGKKQMPILFLVYSEKSFQIFSRKK